MFKTARAFIGIATVSATLLSFSGVAHAGTQPVATTSYVPFFQCVKTVTVDLTTQYGSFLGAASALQMGPLQLAGAIIQTCQDEVAGAQAAQAAEAAAANAVPAVSTGVIQ